MAIRTAANQYVELITHGVGTRVRRVWAGKQLVWESPSVPEIANFNYRAVGDGGLVSWTVTSDLPVTSQQLFRVEPDGSRSPLTVTADDRTVNVGVVHRAGVTRFELHVTSDAGTTIANYSRTINAAPTVHLSFANFVPQPTGTVVLARFSFSYTPGYPAPTSQVQLLSGPGSHPPATIANWIRRGLLSGTLTVTGDSSYRGRTTTIRLTLSNSQGTVHADASCTW